MAASGMTDRSGWARLVRVVHELLLLPPRPAATSSVAPATNMAADANNRVVFIVAS
jgi:hypothetical protein